MSVGGGFSIEWRKDESQWCSRVLQIGVLGPRCTNVSVVIGPRFSARIDLPFLVLARANPNDCRLGGVIVIHVNIVLAEEDLAAVEDAVDLRVDHHAANIGQRVAHLLCEVPQVIGEDAVCSGGEVVEGVDVVEQLQYRDSAPGTIRAQVWFERGGCHQDDSLPSVCNARRIDYSAP